MLLLGLLEVGSGNDVQSFNEQFSYIYLTF